MNLEYVPLLQMYRDVQALPRNFARFEEYLRTVLNDDRSDVEFLPLLAANPMGKEHVLALLDQLLAMDADGIGAQAAKGASAETADVPGEYKASLVLVDDLKGGWTNRWSYEYDLRRPAPDAKRFWVTGYLWTSEPASQRGVREAMLIAVQRTAYVKRFGPARTLRQIMIQEGEVMKRAGCTSPILEPDDLEYTRKVLAPFLDADDMRTVIECLFGDPAARSLGFTPRGLSHWAGIALALHDVRGR